MVSDLHAATHMFLAGPARIQSKFQVTLIIVSGLRHISIISERPHNHFGDAHFADSSPEWYRRFTHLCFLWVLPVTFQWRSSSVLQRCTRLQNTALLVSSRLALGPEAHAFLTALCQLLSVLLGLMPLALYVH